MRYHYIVYSFIRFDMEKFTVLFIHHVLKRGQWLLLLVTLMHCSALQSFHLCMAWPHHFELSKLIHFLEEQLYFLIFLHLQLFSVPFLVILLVELWQIMFTRYNVGQQKTWEALKQNKDGGGAAASLQPQRFLLPAALPLSYVIQYTTQLKPQPINEKEKVPFERTGIIQCIHKNLRLTLSYHLNV